MASLSPVLITSTFITLWGAVHHTSLQLDKHVQEESWALSFASMNACWYPILVGAPLQCSPQNPHWKLPRRRFQGNARPRTFWQLPTNDENVLNENCYFCDHDGTVGTLDVKPNEYNIRILNSYMYLMLRSTVRLFSFENLISSFLPCIVMSNISPV